MRSLEYLSPFLRGRVSYKLMGGKKWDLTVSQFAEPVPYDDTPCTREAALADKNDHSSPITVRLPADDEASTPRAEEGESRSPQVPTSQLPNVNKQQSVQGMFFMTLGYTGCRSSNSGGALVTLKFRLIDENMTVSVRSGEGQLLCDKSAGHVHLRNDGFGGAIRMTPKNIDRAVPLAILAEICSGSIEVATIWLEVGQFHCSPPFAGISS